MCDKMIFSVHTDCRFFPGFVRLDDVGYRIRETTLTETKKCREFVQGRFDRMYVKALVRFVRGRKPRNQRETKSVKKRVLEYSE